RLGQRRCSRRPKVLSWFGDVGGAARLAQGTRGEWTRVYRFWNALPYPADQHRAHSRPTGFDRRRAADGPAVARGPRQCRHRRILETPGRADPARHRLPDKEGTIRQNPALSGQLRHEVLMLLWRLTLQIFSAAFFWGLAASALAQAPPTPSAPA